MVDGSGCLEFAPEDGAAFYRFQRRGKHLCRPVSKHEDLWLLPLRSIPMAGLAESWPLDEVDSSFTVIGSGNL